MPAADCPDVSHDAAQAFATNLRTARRISSADHAPYGNEALSALEQTRASVTGEQYAVVPVAVDSASGQTSHNIYGLTVVTEHG